jgi:hypothetical protein
MPPETHMRRTQALILILALLATPLALIAGVKSCASVACPMCAALQHGKMSVCNCPVRHTGKCGSNGQTQLPDFALASALAPTAPLPFFQMNAPSIARLTSSETGATASHGFLVPPFAPPRS